MNDENIDVERLRNDLENESLGAFFGGGFGGALIEASDIRRMSAEELIHTAERMGINVSDYIC